MSDDTESFQIGEKLMDMMVYAYPALAQFPKSEKFGLAVDIKKQMDEILGLAISARKKYTKLTTIQNMDIANEKLKFYIRLAMRLNFLSMHKYEVWEGMIVEIGKMIGGWLKTVNSRSDHRG